MREHKPGSSNLTHHAEDADPAGAGPGKRSRVEQELGGQGHREGEPIAKAAAVTGNEGGDTPVSGTYSTSYLDFHQGNVFVSESVAATLSHGEGPVSVDISKGGLSIGNEQLTVNLKHADAVTGKHLQVSGASTEIIKNHSSHTGAKMEDGYVGVDYSTSWTIKTKKWSVTLSFSTFVGAKPPHKHHHWWDNIPGLATALAAATALLKIGSIIVESAPEWGPPVLEGLAVAA